MSKTIYLYGIQTIEEDFDEKNIRCAVTGDDNKVISEETISEENFGNLNQFEERGYEIILDRSFVGENLPVPQCLRPRLTEALEL
jgi:hypothetical protein